MSKAAWIRRTVTGELRLLNLGYLGILSNCTIGIQKKSKITGLN